MKKITVFALFLLLIGQTILGPLATVSASGIGSSPIVLKESLATDENGSSFGEENPLQLESIVILSYEWNISEEVEQGQTYSIPLPNGLTGIDTIGLLVSDNKAIGSYKLVGNRIVVTIDEQIEVSVSGTLKVEAKVADVNSFTFGNVTYTIAEESSNQGEEETPTSEPAQENGNEIDRITDESEQDEEIDSKIPEEDLESDFPEDGLTDEEKENEENGFSKEVDPLVDDGISQVIKENILTDYDVEVDDDMIIGITYDWALQNGHGYKAGATYSFTIPPQLKVYNTVDHEEMRFNDKVIGYFSVSIDGTATIEFTDVIENYSNISGHIEVLTEIREDAIIVDGGITITPIEGKESYTIPVNFQPGGPAIEKKGIPNRTYNGDVITWTVDFNKTIESLSNAKLEDVIPEGQLLKEDSMKLYKLNVKWNGDVELGEEVDFNKVGDYDFALELGDINSAYRLVYETEITDADKTTFTNTAILQADNKSDVDATASVSIQRGEPLEKTAKQYNEAEQSIEWEIRYNYNEKAISKEDAILKDFFTNSHELIENSVKVHEITINSETGKESSSEEFTNFILTEASKEGKNGFVLSFNQDIEKAYKITYKTKAKERVYENTEIKNEVASGIYETGEVGREIGPQILFKSHGTPNYRDKEIEWTIRANSDQHTMADIVMEDVFTNAGLRLLPDSIKVTEGQVPLSSGTHYEITENADGFTLTFKKTVESEVIITYETEFDYEARTNKELNYLENKIDMTWKDAAGNEKNIDAIAAFTPDDYTQSNGFKNGSYNAVDKEITWNVGINYNLQTIENAFVEDVFDGNQKLLEDSITVYKMSLTGGTDGVEIGEAIEGEDYKIDYLEENKFRVVFINTISEPYKIEYKTSVDEVSLVAKQYSNTATLNSNDIVHTTLHATVTTPFGGKYIDKSGKQNGKVIDWRSTLILENLKLKKQKSLILSTNINC